jgi:preprotein translocase subunit SecG
MMLLAAWTHYLLGIAMFLTGLFLILVILVQRGRGGGLSGALGGMGGQSAFGTKAGDTFTKITMVTAIFWVLLCMASIKVLMPPKEIGSNAPSETTIGAPTSDAGEEDAAGGAGIPPGGGAGVPPGGGAGVPPGGGAGVPPGGGAGVPPGGGAGIPPGGGAGADSTSNGATDGNP